MSTSGDEVVRRFHGDRISRRYPGVKGYFVGAEYGQSQEHCITDKRTIHRHRLDLVIFIRHCVEVEGCLGVQDGQLCVSRRHRIEVDDGEIRRSRRERN